MDSIQDEKPQARKRSFWTTLPGILTGTAAVVTAVGGLIATLNSTGLLSFRPTSPPSAVSTPRPDLPAPPPGPAVAQNCLGSFFRGIPRDRIAVLEEGARDFDIIGPDQSKEEVIAAQFNADGQPVGAITFRFFAGNNIFKVITVVDARCRETQQYFNAARGGDKRVLQNWDTLQMRLGNANYALRLGYDAGIIGVNYFRRVSP